MSPEASTTALPLTGFLGGIGIATAASLLLLVNGRILGASGFLHRSARHLVSLRHQGGSLALSVWNADFLALGGIIFAGTVVAALESIQRLPSLPVYAPKSTIFRSIAAGLLVGVGSRLQNGCTSGHMICGLSRASSRSLFATVVFTSSAMLVANLAPTELPTVTSYRWRLNRPEAVIFGVQAITVGFILVLLPITWSTFSKGSSRIKNIVARSTTIASSLVFGLALHLSGMTTPARVQGFLISPFFSHPGFDPTMLFLALGALPLSAAAYLIGHQYRIRSGQVTPQCGEAAPLNTNLDPKGQTMIPILASTNDWPSVTGQIDRRLFFGAVLFGCGWGLEGICPGPALVNLGRLIYTGLQTTASAESLRLVVWIMSAIIGGLVVS